jgi:hypothetical protein
MPSTGEAPGETEHILNAKGGASSKGSLVPSTGAVTGDGGDGAERIYSQCQGGNFISGIFDAKHGRGAWAPSNESSMPSAGTGRHSIRGVSTAKHKTCMQHLSTSVIGKRQPDVRKRSDTYSTRNPP